MCEILIAAAVCSLCENAILRILSVQNAPLLLQTAHFREAYALKKRCLSFILDRFGEVIATEVCLSLFRVHCGTWGSKLSCLAHTMWFSHNAVRRRLSACRRPFYKKSCSWHLAMAL